MFARKEIELIVIDDTNSAKKNPSIFNDEIINEPKATFIRRISAASNAIQTIDNEIIMKQIISLSIVLIAFDTAEMRRMNRAYILYLKNIYQQYYWLERAPWMLGVFLIGENPCCSASASSSSSLLSSSALSALSSSSPLSPLSSVPLSPLN